MCTCVLPDYPVDNPFVIQKVFVQPVNPLEVVLLSTRTDLEVIGLRVFLGAPSHDIVHAL